MSDAVASEELAFQQNLDELDRLRKEQQDGLWNYKGDPANVAAADSFAASIQLKIKRCIELTRILRRANTGPAKATGTRGKSRARKAAPDMEAIKSSLYD